jgi:hypothetical protein
MNKRYKPKFIMNVTTEWDDICVGYSPNQDHTSNKKLMMLMHGRHVDLHYMADKLTVDEFISELRIEFDGSEILNIPEYMEGSEVQLVWEELESDDQYNLRRKAYAEHIEIQEKLEKSEKLKERRLYLKLKKKYGEV